MSKIFISVPDGPYWRNRERAIQESEAKSVDVRQQAEDGEGVGVGDSQEEETPEAR